MAGSQERGEAWSSDYAWIVNFNNGNVNNNHRNNTAFVRAVRRVAPASECQGEVSLRALYQAWHAARRNKQPSANQLAFDLRSIDRLLDLQERLAAGTWSPAPTTCFIATRPKAREIHAPDFGDRVVHHWLVPQLEAVYEPTFIHDSYANRKGKGTHAAVKRLQQFVRQVHSGQGGGWYLQLDVHNFFNAIHRPTLYAMLKARLARAGLPVTAMRAVHALLRHPVQRQGVIHRATPEQRAQVPAHKRLENAPPGFGLPIGNLSSQFFANVYLDALDQFVKHVLKARRYLRYVDDFVLVHRDRAVLERWQAQIEQFLGQRLRLRLKDDIRLRPLSAGIDFLGYVVFPTHTRVRRRVVSHAAERLDAWHREHQVRAGVRATPEAIQRLDAIWASYDGHFRHANARRLCHRLMQQRPWLASMINSRRRFSHRLSGRRITVRITACNRKTSR
ncbi:RNA-directed DNA polymerase [Dyella lutea]|uniref:RNA-directed DNA polymerase n=1 Tax=Dyella lutea TaxID=2950441 RepID=A0ABT1FF35_9GAMM|nr:RNA-directed DNA polymerase [Dyella lutea]MCP1375990.1 RNA-directed DNA polymerase [Dyella lutea]